MQTSQLSSTGLGLVAAVNKIHVRKMKGGEVLPDRRLNPRRAFGDTGPAITHHAPVKYQYTIITDKSETSIGHILDNFGVYK